MKFEHLIKPKPKYNIGIDLNQSYCVDCIDGMFDIKDDSIHLILTSPPYDDIYDYDKLDFFEDFAHDSYRILAPGGVLVWIVGDQFVKGSRSLTSHKQAIYMKEEVGFLVHDIMICEKHNFSNPMVNRYHNIYEFMYIYSKGIPRVFNPITDRKNIYAGQTCWGRNTFRKQDGTLGERGKPVISEYGMRHNIWRVKTGKGISTRDEIAYEHPAIFPETLARDHIRTWTNPNDIVLDPMAGSGTTGKMAHVYDRNWILFEINKHYHDDIIVPRLTEYSCYDK
jgi:DNA modification methylase